MTIVNFTSLHLEAAAKIALENYRAERMQISALPAIREWPDLGPFAENGLGVAALEGETLLGFLCCYGPAGNMFRSTDAVGVFSPMEANGVLEAGDNRAEIYARLYQAAAKKWARAGAASHGICLYAHDGEGRRALFENGFGLRCLDAVRELGAGTETGPAASGEYTFAELTPEQWPAVAPLNRMLDEHMAASPCFILRPSLEEAAFVERATENGVRFFAALCAGEPVAFLQVERDGETFVCGEPGYLHITGAFCLPGHRGKGVYGGLLGYAMRRLRQGGCTRLGVDYESINPTAFRFWRKHFAVYTHGLVRRVDEHAVEKLSGANG